jgi:lactam utilization protein B
MNPANETQLAPEQHSVPMFPLKGGVDKPRGADEANGAFSGGKRGISELGAGEFVNKQGSWDAEIEHVGLPDGARLGLPAAAGFGQSQRKSVGGRPSLFTAAVVEKLCLMLALGFSRNQAAAYLKIDKSAISRAAARDPELAAELARAEEMRDLQPQLTMLAEAQTNWKAAAWYLEFRRRHPLPLSEEEKEARHQAELAERRRQAELADATRQLPKPVRRKKVRGK